MEKIIPTCSGVPLVFNDKLVHDGLNRMQVIDNPSLAFIVSFDKNDKNTCVQVTIQSENGAMILWKKG